MKHIGLMLALGSGLLGCDEPLKTVELIAEPRVLGARVEVEGEPGRAAPAPGETASASFLVAAPELGVALGFALGVCSAEPRRGARPACAAEPFAQVVSDAGAVDPAGVTFEVPAELDASGRLAVLGIICPGGSPSADAQSCDGPDPGTPVSLELELAREGDVNSNPTLEPEAILFDDEVWSAQAAMAGDCAGLGYPEVTVGSKHTLEIDLDESDRDPLPQDSELDPRHESLQLSHFATAGDLSRAFESIAWDSSDFARITTWTAPSEPGLVRFWLILRDFRGGSDFTERSVCVR